MFNFLDNYENLTIKTLSSLHWSLKHFDAEYYLKVDDDVFVNLNVILNLLKSRTIRKLNRRYVLGYCNPKSKPIRNPRIKYYVSEEMYPAEFYPPYCIGTTYIVTRSTIQAILPYAATTPLTRLEDISLGILIKTAQNVPIVDIDSWRVDQYAGKTCPMMFTVHWITSKDIARLWTICTKEKNEFPSVVNSRFNSLNSSFAHVFVNGNRI